MYLERLVFYIFSSIGLLSATAVVLFQNPLYSLLSLALTFASVAALWMLLQAEFLSMTLVIVYVGAILVLFLFVIMIADLKTEAKTGFLKSLKRGLLCLGTIAGFAGLFISTLKHFGEYPLALGIRPLSAADHSINHLARVLYTDYLYPLQIVGVLLLLAMVVAIKNHPRKSKA